MPRFTCRDRMCGADDCDTCRPGNNYGKICATCNEEFDECECEEFEPSDEDDEDPGDDYYDREHEDHLADLAADKWEQDHGY